MDRRRFLKMGFMASGATLVPLSLPFAARAKSGAPDRDLDALAKVQGFCPDLCQGHDACVAIDPTVFADNIKRLKKDMGPKVKVCLVMKSDAYGNGVENLMPQALQARAAYIGLVGNAAIRTAVHCMDKTGLKSTILRIAPATFFEAAEAVVRNWPVEEVIGSCAQARALSRIAAWVGKKRGKPVVIPVHINIDTGMGRMGFMHAHEIKKAMALPGIRVKGVMTHYANAYNLEQGEELTRKQLDKFDSVLAGLDLPDDVIVHTANSGAALCFPWARRNMVRVGGALYGDLPPEMNPKGRYGRVMRSFTTRVVWLMDQVPPGTPVGYDSLYHTPKGRFSTLATIKIGYNNGFPVLAFEKGTKVLIRGRRFSVVGKSSMNMVVVDVTGQNPKDKVAQGDEAVIFGRQGDQELTLEDLEKTTGVDACELMLNIGKENPRVIVAGK